MAIGWLTVLKLVPWGDVIENAPKVAQGAKKLWSTVGKKPVPGAADVITPVQSGQGALSGQDGAVAALQAQVAALQVATSELHQQMLESSALIQSLAEQNTQLVQRVELNRKRMLMIGVLTVVLAVVMAAKYI
ncbi:MAG: hypothetical protein PHQ58_13040 [Rhodoferax sp.]|uniref:hypothetical protein n=1 Tax=Rhodoferax sp. TaxID=50421 RepID=UPI0026210541|nr:hypothetical protein [Rhodoferax sp.]MDD2881353.1 hypothetical protein [Rhodoferax sp.]